MSTVLTRPVLTGAQVVLLVALALTVPAQLYLVIPLSPVLATEFTVDSAAWAGSAFAIAYAVGFLVFGPLSERLGRRVVLVAGTAAVAITTVLVAVAPLWTEFLAARAAQGFAAASFAPVALAMVAERAEPARRASVMTAVTGGLLGAGIVGQTVGALAIDAWRWPFWAGAVLYVIATLTLARVLPADRPEVVPSWRGVLPTMGRLLTTRSTATVFASAITVFGGFVALYAVLGPHLAATTEITSSGQVGVRAVGAISLLVAPMLSGVLARRGPRHPAVVGFLTAAAGMLIALAGTDQPVIAVVGSVVVVAGMGLTVPGLVGLLHTLAPGAITIGLNTAVLFAGAAIGQLVATWLGYTTTLIIYAAALAAAATLITSIRRATP
ncbi:MFS transporter [Actinokineospora inagensis]|uniref:MFS transporter n=1 Tax=Actinokineospora inagensis TaxID=103730 RepID=UPI0003F53D5B|nr:MFS transporter [Actinokineospora inagensis]